MKYMLWGALGFIATIIVGLIAIPMLVDVNDYKQQITVLVERYTGRKLTVNGNIKLSLFPSVGLEIHNVTFANPSWMKEGNMASVESLHVEVATLPLLLRQEMYLEAFKLVKPDITLFIDKQGRKNWQLDTSALERDMLVASQIHAPTEPKEKTPPEGKQEISSKALSKLFFGEVSIKDGAVHFRDEQKNKNITLQDINSNVSFASIDEPLTASGSGVWQKQKIDIELQLESPMELLAGRDSPCTAKLSSGLASAQYKGMFHYSKKTWRSKGKLEVKSGDIDKFASWLGNPVQKDVSQGAQKFALDANAVLSAQGVQLDGMEITMGKTAGAGTLKIVKGPVPVVNGDLVLTMLDASPFMQPKAEGVGNKAEGKPGNKTAPAGWSAEPIKLDGLRAFDATIRIKTGKAIIPPLTLGKSDIAITLKQGLLNADIHSMEFYQGNVKGRVVVNAAQKTPSIQKQVTVSNVQLQPWLHDMGATERLSGTLDFAVNTESNGNSMKTLVGSTNGNGKFAISNGTLKGVDLAKMVRNVASAFKSVEQGETDFSDASGTFVINRGIISNQDLVAKSPLLHLTGAGTVNLPDKTINYLLSPKIVGTLKGSQQTEEVAGMGGVTVPVRVEGPFSDIRFRPAPGDMVKDVLSDPAHAKDKLKDMERGVRSLRDNLKLELWGQ